MSARHWVVYLVRCSDNSLYCGVTNDLEGRLSAHNAGKGAKYTRSRRPVELVGDSRMMTKSDAFKLEYRIKRVPPHRKIALLAGTQSGDPASSHDPGICGLPIPETRRTGD